MKKIIKVMALALAICSVINLAACNMGKQPGNIGGEGLAPIPKDVNPWAAYDETVTVKLCVPAAERKWPGVVTGDYSYENNVWTQAWLDEYNLKTVIMWEANDAVGAYDTRLNLAIVSDDLPDIIRTTKYSQFVKLQKAGKLRELDEYFDAYAYPLLKENLSITTEQKTKGTIDGKLYGLGINGNDKRTRLVMIRKDWMNELNLKAPTSMDDVIAIGKKFVDAGKATYALPLYQLMLNGMGDIQAVANSVGAYPRIWFEKNDSLVYGSIQPEMKQTLSIYADLVRGGYVDKAFSSLNSGTLSTRIASGQIGVLLSDYWVTSFTLGQLWARVGTNSKLQEPVDWNMYPIMPMSTYKGEFKVQGTQGQGGIVCVNKNYKNPEVLFKILNFTLAKLDDPERIDTETFHSAKLNEEQYQFFNMNPLYVIYNDPMTNFNTNTNITKAIDNNDRSLLVTGHDKTQYSIVRQYLNERENGGYGQATGWSTARIFYGEDSGYGIYNNVYIKNDAYIFDATNGYESESMVRKWSTMISLEDQCFAKIMSLKEPVTYFESFLEEWYSSGGREIEAELNEWYKSRTNQ